MTNKLFICVFLAAALLSLSGLMFAHHGSGVSYNMSKSVSMEGTVTEFQWRNPHVYIIYDVKDEQGNVVSWGAETHSPVVCEEQDNWSKSTLKPGEKVTIAIRPLRNGQNGGMFVRATLADGQVLTQTGQPKD